MDKFKQLMRKFGASLLHGVKTRWYYFLIIAGTIGLDQLTKVIAKGTMEEGDIRVLIPNFFQFHMIFNDGAAYGMLDDKRWLFMLVSTLGITAFLLYLFAKRERTWILDIGVSFVIGGGIGNMIDRIFMGEVPDFFEMPPIALFGIFNVADTFVCVGGAMIVVALVIQIIQEERKKKAATADGTPAGDAPGACADTEAEMPDVKCDSATTPDEETSAEELPPEELP